MVKISVLPDGSVRLDIDAQSLPALLLVPGAPFIGFTVTREGVAMLDAPKLAILSDAIPQEVFGSLGLSQSSTGGNES